MVGQEHVGGSNQVEYALPRLERPDKAHANGAASPIGRPARRFLAPAGRRQHVHQLGRSTRRDAVIGHGLAGSAHRPDYLPVSLPAPPPRRVGDWVVVSEHSPSPGHGQRRNQPLGGWTVEPDHVAAEQVRDGAGGPGHRPHGEALRRPQGENGRWDAAGSGGGGQVAAGRDGQPHPVSRAGQDRKDAQQRALAAGDLGQGADAQEAGHAPGHFRPAYLPAS